MENNIAVYEFRTSEYIKNGFRLFFKKPKVLLIYFICIWVAMFAMGLVPFVGQIAHIFILVLAQAGFYLLIKDLKESDREDWSALGKLGDVAGQLMVGQIVYLILITVGFICLIIPGIYLSIAYMFFTPKIALEGQNFWDAMESSRKVISKRWWTISGFLFLLMLINLAGICTVIGVLITGPASACAIYFAYEDVKRQTSEAILIPAST